MSEGRVLDPSCVFKSVREALRDAQKSVLLVSPFITPQLFESILREVDNDVQVTLVTRFRPDEIAKGLNSLKLFDVLRERNRGELRLSYHLHAKYYRADNSVILGSGNLTNRGLNTFPGGNHEIMIQVDRSFAGIDQFEEKILAESTVPTEENIADLNEMVECMKLIPLDRKIQPIPSFEIRSESPSDWIPTCESPSSVFNVYLNDLKEIDQKIVQDAKADLSYLSVPAGIDKDQFKKYIRIVIHQSGMMAAFKIELDRNRKLDKVIGIEIIEKKLERSREEAEKLWFSSINWLVYFFPEKFEINS